MFILTGPTKHTRIAGTFVNIHTTVLSSVTWGTDAGIAIDSINTSSMMLTRQWLAVIYVCLALFTTEATGTGASIWGKAIRACSTVLTRIWVCTVININLTVSSTEGKFTLATVTIQFIYALSFVFTRVAAAFIYVHITCFACPPRLTKAAKVINIIQAWSAVVTRIGCTLINGQVKPFTCNISTQTLFSKWPLFTHFSSIGWGADNAWIS